MSDAVTGSHSYWFHFVKEPRYFAGLDEIREPQSTAHRQGTYNGTPKTGQGDGISRDRGWQAGTLEYNPLGKVPGSVWTVPPFDIFDPLDPADFDKEPPIMTTGPASPLTSAAVADYQDATAAVIRHDARNLPLADDSVDLIVTSPPYFALRSYRDDGDHYDGQLGSEDTPAEFVDNLVACMAEWVRVLKPSGSIFVNLGDKFSGAGPQNAKGRLSSVGNSKHWQQVKPRGIPAKSRMLLPHRFAIACIDQLGLICRMDMVWAKPNGLPESVTDRVRAAHEYWFHFVKEPRYFSGLDEIREPQKVGHIQQHLSPQRDMDRKTLGKQGLHDFINPLGRVPGSVWNIPSEPLVVPDEIRQARNLPDHFAAFPQEWPRRLILGFAPTGICTVCDEPRRAEVDTEYKTLQRYAAADKARNRISRNDGNNRDDVAKPHGNAAKLSIITGYACGCPPVGDLPPTRPAVVLDPFGGTGTVAGVARTLGRYGISNDLSADYNRLATWRIWESGHFTKTEQRTWRDRQGTML